MSEAEITRARSNQFQQAMEGNLAESWTNYGHAMMERTRPSEVRSIELVEPCHSNGATTILGGAFLRDTMNVVWLVDG
jgi:hypothetical protein